MPGTAIKANLLNGFTEPAGPAPSGAAKRMRMTSADVTYIHGKFRWTRRIEK